MRLADSIAREVVGELFEIIVGVVGCERRATDGIAARLIIPELTDDLRVVIVFPTDRDIGVVGVVGGKLMLIDRGLRRRSDSKSIRHKSRL